MLTSPPQYMSSLHDAADDNFIYIGSQYPADVHAFRFSAHHGQPPLSVAQPYRASSIMWVFILNIRIKIYTLNVDIICEVIFSRYFVRWLCREFFISWITLAGNVLVCFQCMCAGSPLQPCKFICLRIVISSAKRHRKFLFANSKMFAVFMYFKYLFFTELCL